MIQASFCGPLFPSCAQPHSLSSRAIFISEECLAAHWWVARAPLGSLVFPCWFFSTTVLLKLMRFSSQLFHDSTWNDWEQQKPSRWGNCGVFELTAGCLVVFSETDVENEGCGEVHREREEQREYHYPDTNISGSVCGAGFVSFVRYFRLRLRFLCRAVLHYAKMVCVLQVASQGESCS